MVPDSKNIHESEQVHQDGEQEVGELFIERDTLIAFYKRHDASKIDNVDQALSLFSPEEIIETLKENMVKRPLRYFVGPNRMPKTLHFHDHLR